MMGEESRREVRHVENIDYVFELLPQILSREGKLHECAANTEIMSTDATDDATKAPEKVRLCSSRMDNRLCRYRRKKGGME